MREGNESDMRPPDDDEVVAFMARLAAARLRVSSRLADAGLLWWKAQLLRRWESERRVVAPLEVIEPVQIAAGLAAVVALAMWAVPAVARVLSFVHA
jgi:hypothetical protein